MVKPSHIEYTNGTTIAKIMDFMPYLLILVHCTEPWGLQLNLLFPVVVAFYPHLFVNWNVVDNWTAALTIRQKFNNLQPFVIMVRWQDVLYPIWPQPNRFNRPKTVTQPSKTFWRAVGALIYELRQLFAWNLAKMCLVFSLWGLPEKCRMKKRKC